jgi:hypothetical protein
VLAMPRAGDLGCAGRRGDHHAGGLAATSVGHGRYAPEPDPPYPATVASGRALIVACRNTAWGAQQATKAVAAVNRQGCAARILGW